MQTLGIFCYKKEQYQDIKRMSTNAADMDATWEEWVLNKENAKRELAKSGVIGVDVEVDIFDIINYCQEHGLPMNGKSRARYVSEFLLK